jgi:hypothetical protein
MKTFKRTCDGCSLIEENFEDRFSNFKTIKISINDDQCKYTLDLCNPCYSKPHKINISSHGIIKETNEA